MRLALGLSLLVASAEGREPARALSHYVHDHWTHREGLPQDSVIAAAQTPDGYLWFGTFEGLARFNGVTFKVFNRATDPSLSRNGIPALLTLSSGDLVFTNPGVLGRVVGTRLSPVAEYANGKPDEMAALAEDSKGAIWIGSQLDGLHVARNGRLEPVARERLGHSGIRALVMSADGSLFVGTLDQGLLKLRDGVIAPCPPCESIPEGPVTALARARDGGLWIGGGFGLFRMDAAGKTSRLSVVHSAVTAIRDTDTGLWIGTPAGLARWHDGVLEADPWVKSAVTTLLVDREDSLWVGTAGDGLHRLREAPFTVLGERDGLPHLDVQRLSYLGDTLWISTSGGLFKYLPGEPRVRDAGLAGSSGAWARVMQVHGATWVYTTSGRLYREQGGRLAEVSLPGGPVPNSLGQPSRRGFWIGRDDGAILEIVGGAVARTLRLPRASQPRGIQEWADGRVGIATLEGYYEWRDGEVVDLTPRLGPKRAMVTSLHTDNDGRSWLFTESHGVYRVDRDSMKAITSAQGLVDGTIYSAIDDGLGFLWMTTNRGIIRVAKAELNAVADGTLKSVTPRRFNDADGLSAVECNGGEIARTPDGRLWFPTVKGIAVVDPGKLDLPTFPSLLRIEELRADGRPQEGGVTLRAGVESVEIDYSAQSFRIPSRVRFRYQLEGYDAGFIDAQNRRTAYYPKLPHGSYRFVVHAVNEDGVSDREGAAISFAVAPRFHELPSVRAGLALIGLVSIFGLFRLRTNSLRRRQRVLEALIADRTSALALEKERAEAASRAKSRFVSSVSHELRTPLNAILGFADLLERDRAGRKSAEYLALIKSSGSHLLGLVNSVLSLTKIEEGHGHAAREPFPLASLVREVIATLRPRAEAKGLRLLENADALPAWATGDGPKIRQILINLIGNAIKFTNAGYVALHVTREGDLTTFTVEDTGPGIDERQRDLLFQEFSQTDAGTISGEGTGLGLAISRRLARLQGGTLSLSSSSPQGSKFELTLTLPESAPVGEKARRRAIGLKVRADIAPILIADDSAANRQLLRDLHAILGLTVLEAKDGPSALALFVSARPSLVWTDALMPGFGGLELVQRIRKTERDRGWPRTPVVAITASALGDERVDLLSAGCDSVILKPFEESSIFSVLEETLGLAIAYEDSTATVAGGALTEMHRGVEWTTGLDTEMARIEQAIENGDWEQTRRLAHDLRGACAVRGLADLAAVFGDLEQSAFGRDSKEAMLEILTRARAALAGSLSPER